MKSSKRCMIGAALIAGFVTMAQAEPPPSQDAPAEKSQALLQKVKQGEMDRRITLKQTEIDRLKEDLDKSKKDMDALQQSLDATAALITESGGNLDQLAAERKRLQQSLDLTVLRIEAERRKSEGLRSLSAAQSKALEAITERMAETDVRSRLRAMELQLLSEGKPVPGEENDEKGSPDLVKLKKTLAASELKTATADKIARAAMKDATAKLQLADSAAARATRMSEELKKDNSPEPVAEQPAELTPTPDADVKNAPPTQ